MKVQCPNCGETPYETTDSFNPDILPNGGMVELIGEARAYGHPKFGDRGEGGAEIEYSEMECCWCDTQLAPEGRLKVLSEDAVKSKSEKGVDQVAGMWPDTSKDIVEPRTKEADREPTKKDEIISLLLAEKPLTQADIARRMKTSPAYVSNVARKMREENG